MQNKYIMKVCNHNSAVALIGLNDIPHYYEITVVLEGSFTYTIDGKEYKINAGDGIYVQQGQKRHREPADKNVSYYSINFFCETKDIPNLPTHLKGCVTNESKKLFQLAEASFKDRMKNQRDDILYHYISLIIIQIQNILIKSSINPYIDKMINYISEHLTEKIGLEEVADYVNLSVSYCCYLFKKELKTTIYDFILKERIYLAQDYILNSDLNFNQISNICGFCDYSHFLKSFKKVVGLLPSEYRA